jgi:capsular polysaccharide biosynthesis protein
MVSNKNEEVVIDLGELAYVLFKRSWIMIIAGLIFALSAGIVSKMVLTPIYTSSTKLYVLSKQNKDTTTTYSDLQTGTQLVKDYQVLVKSRPVTEQVIAELNLAMTHETLASIITVNLLEDTRIIEIHVNHSDPIVAKEIADQLAEVSAERMVTIMDMDKANVVEPGNLPLYPSSPNVKKNIMLGGMAGAFLAAVIITIFYIMDDSIKNSDDIENHLRITTLGLIPMEESAIHSRRVKRELKRAYKKGYKGGGKKNAVY